MRTNRGLLKRALVAVGTTAVMTAATVGIATATGGAGGEHQPTDTTTPGRAPKSSQSPALQQQISVVVVGGKMTITPSNLTMTLTRDGGGHYKAALPTIRVVDARGTLAGWTASATPTDLPAGGTFAVRPGHPVAVYGNQREVQAPRTSTQTTLMSAGSDGGGGTFEVDGTVVVTVPHAHASQMTLHVALTVA